MAIAAVAVASATPAQAAIVIGNLPGNNGSLANINQTFTASMGFTMGATSYTLTDAILSLRLGAPTSNAPQLRLTSDLAGLNTLLTFNTPGSLPTGDNQITFTSPSAFNLQAGSTYYLTLGSSNPTGAFYNWLGNNPPTTPTGGTVATANGFRVSSGTQGYLSFQVNGTAASSVPAVPAPPTALLALLGAGAFGSGGWVRRRLGGAA